MVTTLSTEQWSLNPLSTRATSCPPAAPHPGNQLCCRVENYSQCMKSGRGQLMAWWRADVCLHCKQTHCLIFCCVPDKVAARRVFAFGFLFLRVPVWFGWTGELHPGELSVSSCRHLVLLEPEVTVCGWKGGTGHNNVIRCGSDLSKQSRFYSKQDHNLLNEHPAVLKKTWTERLRP